MKLNIKKDQVRLKTNTKEVSYFKDIITKTLCLKNLREIYKIIDKLSKLLEEEE